MATRDSLIKKTIVVGAFGTLGVAALLLAIPWWLGWRGANYWSTAGALAATAGAVFKSAAHAQRFLSVHGLVLNLFHVGRHLLRAVNHRLLRTRAFGVWREVTCV